METKLENCKINLGCGRSATVTVGKNCYVKIEFSNDKDGMTSIDLSENPDLIFHALCLLKDKYPDYEPKCKAGQGRKCVIYYFKRIL